MDDDDDDDYYGGDGSLDYKHNIPVNPDDPSFSQPGSRPTTKGNAPATSTPASHPAPASASASSAPFDADQQISLAEFRLLMGMVTDQGTPYHHPPLRANYSHFWPGFIRRCFKPDDEEAPTSLYYELVAAERYNTFKYRLYDWIVYGGLISQLILSAALIVLGALPSSHHISVALLGAANGVVTGVMSLIKGQGLPTRLIKYVESLRRIREDIEWCERQLRANMGSITFRDAFRLRDNYESARTDEILNEPDIWQTASSLNNSIKNPTNSQPAAKTATPGRIARPPQAQSV